MKIVATQNTAALAGLWFGVVAVVLGPVVDAPGPWSSFWLLVSGLLIAIPMFFFVVGIRRKDMVGLWMFKPDVLKRQFVCFGAVVAVGLLALATRLVADYWKFR